MFHFYLYFDPTRIFIELHHLFLVYGVLQTDNPMITYRLLVNIVVLWVINNIAGDDLTDFLLFY